MTWVLCHKPPFCSLSPKIYEGYLILKIIYSVTKYLIKHPVVYFLSSVSTLKNSSDINVIRHIMTKIMRIYFYCGTNFLNTLYMTSHLVKLPVAFQVKKSQRSKKCPALFQQVSLRFWRQNKWALGRQASEQAGRWQTGSTAQARACTQ